MKRLAFPALFTVVLLGAWVLTKSIGDAGSATSSSSSGQSVPALKSPSKPESLTDKEEMFAGTLSPQNQKIFTDEMTRKQRTMAMEMMTENNRSGGSLNSDQAVEMIYKDMGAPQDAVPMTPPSSSASPAKPVPQPSPQPVAPPSGSQPGAQPAPNPQSGSGSSMTPPTPTPQVKPAQ